MTKPTKWHVRPAKTQISLGIRPVWSESLLRAQGVAKDPSFLHADSEDSDRTGRKPKLIRVFAGRTYHFLVLSWGGSYFLWFRLQVELHRLQNKYKDSEEVWHAKQWRYYVQTYPNIANHLTEKLKCQGVGKIWSRTLTKTWLI